MKLQSYEQAAAPEAGALSVSLSPNKIQLSEPATSPKKEEEDLWQEISDELSRGTSPAWRMWR